VNVVYSQAHRQHEPLFELENGGPVPHPEVAARAERILAKLRGRAEFDIIAPTAHGLERLQAVHTPEYLAYLESAYGSWLEAGLPPGGVIPDTFPPGRRSPHQMGVRGRAGRFCFDTGTPIDAHTWHAARCAADVALTAADLIIEGHRTAYALCRPPGHHAGRSCCGGFCYVNNAAVAAARLLDDGAPGHVAVLDIDYHHGNGTQDIFYGAATVHYVSIHADPGVAYPYFSGFADETGVADGVGWNLNLPLPIGVGEAEYLATLDTAIECTAERAPAVLVVSLGVDAVDDDPIGGFRLPVRSFARIADRIAELDVPVLVVQEGGYDLDTIGDCVSEFLLHLDV